ncbi:hypothetical protein PVAG01_09605 [Phlyctema vagabunda]|uniref:Uncharacterized protein n=1 Tax=Phlyctema vagabunda TaxID=108571 RepID=A0ABR4P7U6_9HELO
MPFDSVLDRQLAQLSHFNKMLARLDNEMLCLSREHVQESTTAALEVEKSEFDKVGEDVIRALGAVESSVFQNIAKSSVDVQNHIDNIGAALVNATNDLNKAWTKHSDDEQGFRQDKAYTRRRIIRITRQEIWEEKCRVIDGEDAIRDREIAEWEQQSTGLEDARPSLDMKGRKNSGLVLARRATRNYASIANPATPPESPRSVEILADIGAEITRLEEDHEAAARMIKAEQEARATAASEVDSLQSHICILEQALVTTNHELQSLRAEKAQCRVQKRRRYTRSEGDLSRRASTGQQLGPVETRTSQEMPALEDLIAVGAELRDIQAVRAELRKEKDDHEHTRTRLVELQEFTKMRDSSTEPGDLKKFMKRIKPLKGGRSPHNIQRDLEENEKALNLEKEEHTKTSVKLKALEKQLKLQEPLLDVGRRVRCKFLENSKRVFANGVMVAIRGQVDLQVIRAGGEAAYQGDVQADAALFSLGFLDPSKDKRLFEDLYACPVLIPPSRALDYPRLTEMFNMRATMGYCSSFTEYTLSQEDDAQFQQLERECISILSGIQRNPTATENVEVVKGNTKIAFETSPEVGARLEEMRKVVQHILRLERTRSKIHP